MEERVKLENFVFIGILQGVSSPTSVDRPKGLCTFHASYVSFLFYDFIQAYFTGARRAFKCHARTRLPNFVRFYWRYWKFFEVHFVSEEKLERVFINISYNRIYRICSISWRTIKYLYAFL